MISMNLYISNVFNLHTLNIKNDDYHGIIRTITKYEAIKLLKNIDLLINIDRFCF